jgi:hypothetical protein
VTLGAALFQVSNVLSSRRAPTRAQQATTQDDARPSDAAPPPAEVAEIQTPAPTPAPAPPDEAGDAEDARPVSHTRPTITRVSAKGRAPASAMTAPSPARPPTQAQAATPKREEKRSKPAGESAKKESKLGSILKKTGRVLKKPFGF